MGVFQWKENFNIGIEDIDRQHRLFLTHLNDYDQQISQGKRHGIDPELVQTLRTYATTHFRFEESLMEARGFPEIAPHKRQHALFESQVSELETLHADASGRSARSALMFLHDWFLKHILEEDKKIVRQGQTGQ